MSGHPVNLLIANVTYCNADVACYGCETLTIKTIGLERLPMISEETSVLSMMHGDLITYYSVTIITVIIYI